MNIIFTVEQVQQMLAALGEIPSKYSINLITFIKQVAEQQIAAQQVEESSTQVEETLEGTTAG